MEAVFADAKVGDQVIYIFGYHTEEVTTIRRLTPTQVLVDDRNGVGLSRFDRRGRGVGSVKGYINPATDEKIRAISLKKIKSALGSYNLRLKVLDKTDEQIEQAYAYLTTNGFL